jgi:hypothetical protein
MQSFVRKNKDLVKQMVSLLVHVTW